MWQGELAGLPGFAWKEVQKRSKTGQDLSQVVPDPAENCADRIAFHALEDVPSEKPIAFHKESILELSP